MSDDLANFFLNLLNLAWVQQEVPNNMAMGLIWPLYIEKAPENYKAIDLGKVFWKILNERQRTWVPEQAGFSVVGNSRVINTFVERELKQERDKIYACLINFKKAFDPLDRELFWGS